MDNFGLVLVLGFVSVAVLAIGVAVYTIHKPTGKPFLWLGVMGLLVTVIIAFRGSTAPDGTEDYTPWKQDRVTSSLRQAEALP
jgi:hypothetical protein